MATYSLILGGIVTLLGYLIYQHSSRKNRRKLPPGPKPLPIVGNLRDFPPDGTPEFQHWLKHKDLYGGISSVTVMGMTLVIIHDRKAAHELLERTSSKTSERPTMVMANTLCGYGSVVAGQGYTPTFRRYRKYLHQELGTKVSAAQFEDVQEMEVSRQLLRALKEPEKWLEHYKTTAAAAILRMTYGYVIEPFKPDTLVKLVDTMLHEFSLAATPFAWTVDIIPALQYLPEYFPGASFKKIARKWRKTIHASAYIPYQFTRNQLAGSSYRPSYVSKHIQNLSGENSAELNKDDEEAIIWTAVSLYGAASDTTVVTLSIFTFAMVKFQHVQRKAQEEIDRVIGRDRLPNFKDRENLPYINALVKEAMRSWPIVPMGLPHNVAEDLEYDGFRIPKNAMILPAVWWFMHDPEVYADPESFDPERFLPPRNEPDPTSDIWGYGRRICPGRYFADSGVYLNIAQSLAAFTFSKAMRKDGKEIEVDIKVKPGMLAYPTDFEFQIKPRSDKYVELIKEVEKRYPWEASDGKHLDSVEDFEPKY